jgi:hypothetical protein
MQTNNTDLSLPFDLGAMMSDQAFFWDFDFDVGGAEGLDGEVGPQLFVICASRYLYFMDCVQRGHATTKSAAGVMLRIEPNRRTATYAWAHVPHPHVQRTGHRHHF